MEKTVLNSSYLPADETLDIKDCSSMEIHNYTDGRMSVTHGYVTEDIPAYDAVNDVVSSWVMMGDGTLSDVLVKVVFAAGKTGEAVLRYRSKIQKTC